MLVVYLWLWILHGSIRLTTLICCLWHTSLMCRPISLFIANVCLAAGTRRCMEVPSLQADAAGDGEDELMDPAWHPHSAPEAFSAGGQTAKQAVHPHPLPCERSGYDTPCGETQSEHEESGPVAFNLETWGYWLPLRPVCSLQPPRRHAWRPLHRWVRWDLSRGSKNHFYVITVTQGFFLFFISSLWFWPCGFH